jgi:hypothetical protein
MIQLTSACPALLFPPLPCLPQTYFETTHSPASICGKQKQLGFPSVFLDFEYLYFVGLADPPSTCCPASTVAPLVRSTKTGKKHFRKCGAV